jgi:sensor histidine kinase YesM
MFVFSWVLSLKQKLDMAHFIGRFTFHFDAPFWIFINAMVIFISLAYLQRKNVLAKHHKPSGIQRFLAYFFIGLIIYLLYINLFSLTIAFAFGTLALNYGSAFQTLSTLLYQVSDFIIFGGISFGYLYFLENKIFQQRINNFELSLSKAKIQQLQKQLNPHFLFNNLNILDQLIEENKNKAADFLGLFSDLYRFALVNTTKDLIPLEDEIEFTNRYFEIIKYKYVDYYQLNFDKKVLGTKTIVPPFCLQLLIENAIFHNQGSSKRPVTITVSFNNGIKVSNNKIQHGRKRSGNGIALKNLSEQFQLLTNSAIIIDETTNTFSVSLPLIKTRPND